MPVPCANCGMILDEPLNLREEDREPCPRCGSIGRPLSREITDRIGIADPLAVERRPAPIQVSRREVLWVLLLFAAIVACVAFSRPLRIIRLIADLAGSPILLFIVGVLLGTWAAVWWIGLEP